jgi:cell division protein FtsW
VVPARILGPRLLLIVTTIALLIFGLVMVYSASFVEAFTNPNIQDSSYIFKHQLRWVGLGVVALIVAAVFDYRVWNTQGSWAPWSLVVILLVVTWAVGNEELGGQRWLDIFGYNLQPSEFAKIAMMLTAAMLLVKLHESSQRTPILWSIAAAVGLPTLLILLQPDLGTALIALAGIIAVAWFGELPLKPFGIAVVLTALVGVGAIKFAGFRMGRIDSWLDTWTWLGSGLNTELVQDGNRQIVNALYAFGDGGVFGVGLGMSHQKYLYLSQSYNDLIFPIIGEELGLIGVAVAVILFLVFLYAAYRIAQNAPDLYGRIVAGAAASMIGFQAFLNMLCTVNILPLTGKPLPFFSAGGSSIIVTLILVGLILNVSLRSTAPDEATARRDQLLILEGGRRAKETPARDPLKGGLLPLPAFDSARATTTVAKQSASGGRFRKPPARKLVAPAAKPVRAASPKPAGQRSARASEQPRRDEPAAASNSATRTDPTRNANPARKTNASPARETSPARKTNATPARKASPARKPNPTPSANPVRAQRSQPSGLKTARQKATQPAAAKPTTAKPTAPQTASKRPFDLPQPAWRSSDRQRTLKAVDPKDKRR